MPSTEPARVPDVEPEQPQGDTPDEPAASRSRLAAGIASGERERRSLSGGVIAQTSLVDFNDGTRAINKIAADVDEFGGVPAEAQQDAEELTAAVMEAVGARAPAVERTSPTEIYMEFVPGTIAAESPYRNGRPDIDYDSDQSRFLGLADQLTHNFDRHSGNWLVGEDGEPVPIDHGMAFGRELLDNPEIPLATRNRKADQFARHFRSAQNPREWADNDLSPNDVATIRGRLQELEPRFAAAGRQDWYNAMMTRYDIIGSRATGTRDRL